MMEFKIVSDLFGIALPFVLLGMFTDSAGGDEPSIAKDSIRITFENGSSGAFEKPGWVPAIQFRVNGPVADGSILSVEFSLPDKTPWVSFDLPIQETEKGANRKVEGGGSEALSNNKAVVYSGPLGFSITLRNELAGTSLTLFKGTAKVDKRPSSDPDHYWTSSDFFVDDDWKIPIGYLFFEEDSGHMNQSFLHALFWYRGNPAEVDAHLFYKGKDIAKCNVPGNTGSDYNPKKSEWGFAKCQFLGVYPTEMDPTEGYDPNFAINKNSDDYEVKALIAGRLARSIKFTVDAKGKFDNGIATSNKLGSNRVIVPVQVIGNAETWDKAAWKTGAFYGNPLTGFTAL